MQGFIERRESLRKQECQKEESFTQWNQFHLNIRAMSKDEQIEELTLELGAAAWDSITVNETRRGKKEEEFALGSKHLYFGSGGSTNKHGVGIFLHSRWAKKVTRFQAISPRVAALDLELDGAKGLRIIAAYFPHCGYPDAAVQEMYTKLIELLDEARRLRLVVIIGADCNAEVGGLSGKSRSYGGFGNPICNERGHWLQAWAEASRLALTNTWFKKKWSKTWTHASSSGRQRQIDYILVDRWQLQFVTDAEVIKTLDMGSDHKALRMAIRIPRRQRKRKWKQSGDAHGSFKHWQADDVTEYADKLEKHCQDTELFTALDSLTRTIEDKCALLRNNLVQVAAECRRKPTSEDPRAPRDDQILKWIEDRRSMQHEQPEERRRLSKNIQRAIRKSMRKKHRQQIDRIIQNFEGLRKIADIKNNGKKSLLSGVVDREGTHRDDRQQIADVFAEFYEDLYKSRVGEDCSDFSGWEPVPGFTADEVNSALAKMKRGKASDHTGLVIELLKDSGGSVRKAIASIFNDILVKDMTTPEEWKKSRVIVLFKKGDTQKPENYRPITLLPVLYKLFSRMLQARIKSILEDAQPVDQAGFRSGFSCADHLQTISMVAEKMNEHRLPLWVCAIDFKKAFDTVEHRSLWQALKNQGIPRRYVALLQDLYQGQTGQVITDKVSRPFRIARGTKQGDPISPSLFSSVLEDALSSTVKSWEDRNFGLEMGSMGSTRLTNLRFADDILLIATSKQDIVTMLSDLWVAAGSVGLELHMGKTKILTNRFAREDLGVQHCEVQGEKVEILSVDDTVMYLGRKLSLSQPQEVELESRMHAAWATFMKNRSVLCSRKYPLQARLKLFETTVSKSALYGSETWTMRAQDRRQLRSTQRRMLRWMVGQRRTQSAVGMVSALASGGSGNSSSSSTSSTQSEPQEQESEQETGADGEDEQLEDFVSWMQRTTGLAVGELAKARIEDWVTQQRRRYWRWAGHITRLGDQRWTGRASIWQPAAGSRAVGHPKKRWEDDLITFADGCEDRIGGKRIRFMWRHCGESTSCNTGKYNTNTWRRWWKDREEDFVAVA